MGREEVYPRPAWTRATAPPGLRSSPMKTWTTVSSETLFAKPPLLTLERRRLREIGGGDGAEERDALVVGSGDWVHVVPVLDDGRILLIRQWRYGSESFHLELPGGIVEEGDPEGAGRRELAEETGYEATGPLELLGVVDPNPAIQSNRLHVYRATSLRRLAPEERPEGDEDEEIELVPVAPEAVPGMVERGEICHALALSTLYLHQLRPVGAAGA